MKGLEISTKDGSSRPDVVVGTVSGYLDSATAEDLTNYLESLLSDARVRIVLDLHGLQYISSAGLGAFTAAVDRVRERSGDIKLAGMTGKVHRVFDLLGFAGLFHITESVEEAVAAFPPAPAAR